MAGRREEVYIWTRQAIEAGYTRDQFGNDKVSRISRTIRDSRRSWSQRPRHDSGEKNFKNPKDRKDGNTPVSEFSIPDVPGVLAVL
jgi:hypothetical protein